MKRKYNCQKIKNSINEKSGMFVEFVAMCLDDAEFEKAMNELLPFDNLGLSIMRMEPESPLFSLGISIELVDGEENKAVNTTIFISACRTQEELREFVKTDAFSMQVKENFEKQIEESFSSQDKVL